jgi:hypothetical protein
MVIDVPNHTNHRHGLYARDVYTLNISGTHLTKSVCETKVFDLIKDWEEVLGTILVNTLHGSGLDSNEFGDEYLDVQNLGILIGPELEPGNRILFCFSSHLP